MGKAGSETLGLGLSECKTTGWILYPHLVPSYWLCSHFSPAYMTSMTPVTTVHFPVLAFGTTAAGSTCGVLTGCSLLSCSCPALPGSIANVLQMRKWNSPLFAQGCLFSTRKFAYWTGIFLSWSLNFFFNFLKMVLF